MISKYLHAPYGPCPYRDPALDIADQLRSEAAAAAGNKLARRKHQIGTLLANAKLHELELLEKNPSVSLCASLASLTHTSMPLYIHMCTNALSVDPWLYPLSRVCELVEVRTVNFPARIPSVICCMHLVHPCIAGPLHPQLLHVHACRHAGSCYASQAEA